MWCFDIVAMSVVTNVGISLIIGENDDDVGTRFSDIPILRSLCVRIDRLDFHNILYKQAYGYLTRDVHPSGSDARQGHGNRHGYFHDQRKACDTT